MEDFKSIQDEIIKQAAKTLDDRIKENLINALFNNGIEFENELSFYDFLKTNRIQKVSFAEHPYRYAFILDNKIHLFMYQDDFNIDYGLNNNHFGFQLGKMQIVTKKA